VSGQVRSRSGQCHSRTSQVKVRSRSGQIKIKDILKLKSYQISSRQDHIEVTKNQVRFGLVSSGKSQVRSMVKRDQIRSDKVKVRSRSGKGQDRSMFNVMS